MTVDIQQNFVYVSGLGMVAPGFSDEQQITSILSGETKWQFSELQKLLPTCLPANERRRTTTTIKLAIQVAQLALQMETPLLSPATVFASSDGDFSIVDRICSELCEENKNVSPTQFHNSVHNAPAGYWAIAAKCQLPSTSISAGDATFAAGLLEAMTQVQLTQQPVLFVAYDVPAPFPLDEKRHFEFAFGVAMLLTANAQADSRAQISYIKIDDVAASCCEAKELAAMQNGNPIANSLPLLESIYRGYSKRIFFPYYDQRTLGVEVNHD